MTAEVRTVRTEAETALIAAFDRIAAALPGGARARERRAEAMERFRHTGLPHRRIEEWKYTDLRALMRKVAQPASRPAESDARSALTGIADPLAGLDRNRLVLVDGYFFADLSDVGALRADGIDVESFATVLGDDRAASLLDAGTLSGNDIAVGLNTALATDGVVVRVRDGAASGKPLEILHLSTGTGAVSARSRMEIGAGSHVAIIETHRGSSDAAYQTNVFMQVDIASRARVSYARFQAEGANAIHIGSTILNVAEGTQLSHLSVAAGAAVSRSQIFLTTGGASTKVALNGATMIGGRQHSDGTLLIDHALPGANTRVLYKSVIDGNADGVFQGKVIVEPDAQKTDAKMMSKALLVSETAAFSAKPELEIYADDVQCGHGATSGQIDDTQLFYLMARGVPRAEAERLLIEAFLDDAIDGLGHEGVAEALKRQVSAWLEKRPARV